MDANLKAAFEAEIDKYLAEQERSGFDITKVSQILESRGKLDGALLLAGGEKINTLWVLKKLGSLQYSIEALCIKEEYKDLIPVNIRLKSKEKLRSLGFDLIK